MKSTQWCFWVPVPPGDACGGGQVAGRDGRGRAPVGRGEAARLLPAPRLPTGRDAAERQSESSGARRGLSAARARDVASDAASRRRRAPRRACEGGSCARPRRQRQPGCRRGGAMSTRYVTKAALVRDPLVALRRREGGVVGRKAAVLESVYGITKRPGIDHERRLAAQLGLEHAAVNLWFRNRRVSEKRAARRRLMLLGLGTWAHLSWRDEHRGAHIISAASRELACACPDDLILAIPLRTLTRARPQASS